MYAFLSSFVSYVVLMLILACLAVAGTFAGIALRKNKNSKEAVAQAPTSEE